MRTLRTGISNEMFKHARGVGVIGAVYALERNKECIPFSFDGKKYVVEFNIPYFLTQAQLYEDMLLPTESGGVFVPKLEHRYIDVMQVGDDDVLTNLCHIGAASAPQDPAAFAAVLRAAVLAYYRSSPHANQYFFRTDATTKPMLVSAFTDLPDDLKSRYTVETHAELAEPLVGFSIVSNAL